MKPHLGPRTPVTASALGGRRPFSGTGMQWAGPPEQYPSHPSRAGTRWPGWCGPHSLTASARRATVPQVCGGQHERLTTKNLTSFSTCSQEGIIKSRTAFLSLKDKYTRKQHRYMNQPLVDIESRAVQDRRRGGWPFIRPDVRLQTWPERQPRNWA